jgi:hypothetical protein
LDGRDRATPAEVGPGGGDEQVGEGVDREEGLRIDQEKLQAEPKGPRPFLPKRWIVERTLSWLSQNRRLSLGTTRGCRRAHKP